MNIFPRLARIFLAALAAACAAGGAAGSAALGAESAYRAEYTLYLEALSNGDPAAAERHAEAAWRAAEEELGDDALTAVLAFNFGKYVLFSRTEAAQGALERALQLAEAGHGALPSHDLSLYLAYCRFKLREERAADADALFTALKARDLAGGGADFESASIWLHTALYQLNKKEYELAIESAGRAEQSFAEALPDHHQSRAQAIIVRGAAMLLPIPRTPETFNNAHAEFVRAQALFPLQKSIDSFDPVLATAMAWDSTTHGALLSDEPKNIVDQITADWAEPPPPVEGYISDEDCEGQWRESGLRYPTKALDWGTIGAVVIGFHLREDGHTEEPRILAEVPGVLFGKHVLGRVRGWRHETPLDPREGCRRNRIHSVSFSIR